MDLNVYTVGDAVPVAEAVKQDDAPATEIADPSIKTSSGTDPQVSADDTYAKVLKFVPAPLIGIYIAVTNAVLTKEDPSETLLWIILAVFLAATVGFLLMRGVKRVAQIAISVVAFAAVATATPGPFQTIDGWDTLYSTLILAAVGVLLVVFPLKPIPTK